MRPTRWLVLGAHGMLGRDLVEVLRAQGADVVAAGRGDVDILDGAAVERGVADADVVVNCAAYTAVDAAESDQEAAERLNGDAAGVVARACAAAGARMVHVSTDYVFAGDAAEPYSEDAPIAPVSVYGMTKASGERQVRESGADALIVRTAWLYGEHGACFPKTIAKVAADRGAIAVVDDQRGQPTWTRDLADLIVRLIAAGAPAGTYHGTSSGSCTWFEFARDVLLSADVVAELTPTTTDAFPRPAPRPAWSVLGHDATVRAGVESIGHWRDRWLLAAQEVVG
ncbi:dTDP-4-dehydrorhamnose reductase [Demequina sp. NBRC 110051]|uniref:dTDP-4-dehydrorhamnose reductase n=1 Tax=Demequina sp. NBRC 110051 TaxID=1570340 RepID=UPI00352A29C4